MATHSHSCLENPMDRGAWWATIQRFPESDMAGFLFKSIVVYFNWRIITLQYCYSFCHTSIWIGHRYTCIPSVLNPFPPPSHPIPPGCPRALALGAPHHTSNLQWLSILHMVMYMFQCYSPKLSHPLLLLLCSKVYSLCLCLLCCSVLSIVGNIFLDSIYVC